MHLEAMKSEMDVFASTPVQATVEHGRWVTYQPISSVENNSTLHFISPPSHDECIDLALTMLHLKVQVVKTDGSQIPDDAPVAPVNNLLHSLFSQVEVYLNQKLITPSANAYPYRAYIETLLNYDQAAKNSHLAASLWSKDTAGEFNSVSPPTTNNNLGFKTRHERCKGSRLVELYGPLFGDIFNVNKYLLTGVELEVKLMKSKDSFALMAGTDDFKILIKEASLQVRKSRIAPRILLAHESALKQGNAKYPYTRTETKMVTIGAGIKNISLDNVFRGPVPKRVVLGLVSNYGASGSFKKNPFHFHHYSLNNLSLYVDNEQFPSKPLRPDFAKEEFTTAYYSLFTGTGIHFKDAGNDITLEEYPKGYTLYAFDLTPDLSASSSSHWNPDRNANLRIELGFAETTPVTLNCVVYAEFQALLQIDQHRNIITDS